MTRIDQFKNRVNLTRLAYESGANYSMMYHDARATALLTAMTPDEVMLVDEETFLIYDFIDDIVLRMLDREEIQLDEEAVS